MPDLQFILDEVRKEKRSNLWVGPGLSAMGIVIILFLHAGSDGAVMSVLSILAKIVFGGLFTVGGIAMFRSGLQPPEKEEAIVLLRTNPEKIVWAHVVMTQRNGQNTSAVLALHLEDGNGLRVAIPPTDASSERALAVVHEVAPRAALGFSPEREAQFAKDPASLRTS